MFPQILIKECNLLLSYFTTIELNHAQDLRDIRDRLKKIQLALENDEANIDLQIDEIITALDAIHLALWKKYNLVLYFDLTKAREEACSSESLLQIYLRKLTTLCKAARNTLSNWRLINKDIEQQIYNRLDDQALQCLRATSKSNQEAINHFHSNQYPYGRFFFAVGKPIDLYGTAYSEYTYESYRVSLPITDTKVNAAILNRKKIPLFKSYAQASNYRYFKTYQRHKQFDDIFHDEVCTPIYIVNLKNSFYHKSRIEELSDYWLRNSPCPPKVTTAKIPITYTPTSNLNDVHFIKNYQRFFKVHPNPNLKNLAYEFSITWQTKMDEMVTSKNHKDLSLIAQQCIIALFESYSAPVYARFTRNHQIQTKQILADINQIPDLNTLQNYFHEKLKTAKSIPNINQQGHYYSMLEFTLNKLGEFKEISKMEDINNFLDINFRPKNPVDIKIEVNRCTY